MSTQKNIGLDQYLEKGSLEKNLISDPNFPSQLLCETILRGFEIQNASFYNTIYGDGEGTGYGEGTGEGYGGGYGKGSGSGWGSGNGYGSGTGYGIVTYMGYFNYEGTGWGRGDGWKKTED